MTPEPGDIVTTYYRTCAWPGSAASYNHGQPHSEVPINKGTGFIFVAKSMDHHGGLFWDVVWHGKLWHISPSAFQKHDQDDY